jgi:hypothetical protein
MVSVLTAIYGRLPTRIGQSFIKTCSRARAQLLNFDLDSPLCETRLRPGAKAAP